MRRSISAVLLILPLCALPVRATAPAIAGEPPTCRGLTATHVGVPGDDLTTTAEDDVVVTNGARDVRTLGGNDVICATRARQVDVVPGSGDDVVDASGYHGPRLRTYLGIGGVPGSSGDDIYLGGRGNERILVYSGDATDNKQIRTAGGQDVLKIGAEYAGEVTAKLGRDGDGYLNNAPRAGVSVDGGAGYDWFDTKCRNCDAAEINLTSGAVRVDEAAGGDATGFEGLTVYNRRLAQLRVVGNDAGNSISVNACQADVLGRGRDDSLSVGNIARDLCIAPSATIDGGRGNDVLTGARGDDVLLGGRGNDEAWGEAGEDRCDAETRHECES